jgi:hypothetical protein
MENQPINDAHNNRAQTLRENWQVMKPFVHFAFKAMAVIGGALIGIVKLLPMLAVHRSDDHKKDNKIIEI